MISCFGMVLFSGISDTNFDLLRKGHIHIYLSSTYFHFQLRRKELHWSVLPLPQVCTPLKDPHGPRRRKKQLPSDFHSRPFTAASFLTGHTWWRESEAHQRETGCAVQPSMPKWTQKSAIREGTVSRTNTAPSGRTGAKSDYSGMG